MCAAHGILDETFESRIRISNHTNRRMSQKYFLILTVTGFLTVCSENYRSCLALCRLNPSSPDRYEKSAAPLLGYRGFWCRWPARRKVGVVIRQTCHRHVCFAANAIVPALPCADFTLRVRTVTKNPRHPFWGTADFGAGGRTRTGTLSPAVDFEFFNPSGKYGKTMDLKKPFLPPKTPVNISIPDPKTRKSLIRQAFTGMSPSGNIF